MERSLDLLKVQNLVLLMVQKMGSSKEPMSESLKE